MTLQFSLFCGLATAGDTTPATVKRNRERLIYLADRHLPDGYTLTDTIGRWNGQSELSVVITVIGDHAYSGIRLVGQTYKKVADQEAVLLTTQEVTTNFI